MMTAGREFQTTAQKSGADCSTFFSHISNLKYPAISRYTSCRLLATDDINRQSSARYTPAPTRILDTRS